MAIALESGAAVWRKVEKALTGASPAAQLAFKGLRRWLVEQNKNPDLQFIPFSAADIVTNTGYSPIGVPGSVYGIYVKNSGTGDGTDSFFALHNAADNASAALFAAVIQDDDDEIVALYPLSGGLAFGTDLTLSAATTIGGATESAEANAGDGFVIVGAA